MSGQGNTCPVCWILEAEDAKTSNVLRPKVLTAMTMEGTIFWDVIPCTHSDNTLQKFKRLFASLVYYLSLKMEAVSSTTIWQHTLKDSTFQQHFTLN
jgi:hypothetical protein